MIGFDFIVPLNNILTANANIKELLDLLQDKGFNNEVSLPNVIIFKNSLNDQIIITQNQYIFKIAREYEWKEILGITGIISSTIRPYQKALNSNFTVRLVDAVKCDSVFDKINNLVNIDYSEKETSNIMGVGLRFFVNNKDKISEFKVEPWLADKKSLFYEGVYNFDSDLTKVSDICNDAYNDFSEKVSYFSSLLTK